ncbi:dephospho-CoA kinase [Chitinophagaceae bacterium LWZ2-11]
MLKIGITGGIGSGKSTISRIFKTFGIPVFDADSVAKNIMQEDEVLKQQVKETFGDESYKEGKLDRKYLANIVFNDAHQLELLNSIVHPATIRAATNWMKLQKTDYVIKEAALLFEAGSAGDLDYVIGVYAPQYVRIKRVMSRDNISREDVLARMNKQIDEELKMKLCDFVIVNDSRTAVIPQVLKVHEELLQLLHG